MKQQKCRLCGHEHAIREPHIFDNSESVAEAAVEHRGEPRKAISGKAKNLLADSPRTDRQAILAGRPRADRDGPPSDVHIHIFDRRAYQRTYMVKYRARKALEKAEQDAELKLLREMLKAKEMLD